MSQQNSNLNTGDIPLFPATEDNPKSHLEQAINELTHVILTSDEPFNFSYSDPNSDKTITLSNGNQISKSDNNSDKKNDNPDNSNKSNSDIKSEKDIHETNQDNNSDSDIKSDERKDNQSIEEKDDATELKSEQNEIDKQDDENNSVTDINDSNKNEKQLSINSNTGLNSVEERQLTDYCREITKKMEKKFPDNQKKYRNGSQQQKQSIAQKYVMNNGFYHESQLKTNILKVADNTDISILLPNTCLKLKKGSSKKNKFYFLPALALNLLTDKQTKFKNENKTMKKVIIKSAKDFLITHNIMNSTDDLIMASVLSFNPNVLNPVKNFTKIQKQANKNGKVFNQNGTLYKKASANSIKKAVNELRHNCTDYNHGIHLVNQIKDPTKMRSAYKHIVQVVFESMEDNFPELSPEINRQWREHLARY